jgi:hypothetical protein
MSHVQSNRKIYKPKIEVSSGDDMLTLGESLGKPILSVDR